MSDPRKRVRQTSEQADDMRKETKNAAVFLKETKVFTPGTYVPGVFNLYHSNSPWDKLSASIAKQRG